MMVRLVQSLTQKSRLPPDPLAEKFDLPQMEQAAWGWRAANSLCRVTYLDNTPVLTPDPAETGRKRIE